MRSFVKHVDCIEGMRDMRDGSVDLIFADLPYGRTMSKWDKLVPMDLFWEQARRVAKNSSDHPHGDPTIHLDGRDQQPPSVQVRHGLAQE
jgi:hypothetical protein